MRSVRISVTRVWTGRITPEFTCMEVYVPYKDYLWMMDSTERMIEAAAMAVNGTTKAPFGENEVDFKRPFKRVKMSEAIKEYTGFDITGKSEDEIPGILFVYRLERGRDDG